VSQIVVISSKMGSIGDGRTGGSLYGYRMSKAAANCAGATLARDLKEDQIAVGLIHPGAVSQASLQQPFL
jgi:NAD(P)-dependent dehydrogenase (short-subunit alcohol dehydrogenase family)